MRKKVLMDQKLALKYFIRKTFFHPYKIEKIIFDKLKEEEVSEEGINLFIEEYGRMKSSIAGTYIFSILSIIISLIVLLMSTISIYSENYIKILLSYLPKQQQINEFSEYIGSGIFKMVISTIIFFWEGGASLLVLGIGLLIVYLFYSRYIFNKRISALYMYKYYKLSGEDNEN